MTKLWQLAYDYNAKRFENYNFVSSLDLTCLVGTIAISLDQ